MAKITVQKLTRICMITADVDKCARFYIDKLGFEIAREVKKGNGEHFIFIENDVVVIPSHFIGIMS